MQQALHRSDLVPVQKWQPTGKVRPLSPPQTLNRTFAHGDLVQVRGLSLVHLNSGHLGSTGAQSSMSLWLVSRLSLIRCRRGVGGN
jgi:hypothetical protein